MKPKFPSGRHQWISQFRRNENDTETSFAAHLKNAAYLCVNVQLEHKKLTVYLEGLFPSLSTIFLRFRNETPVSKLIMELVVQFACKEGDDYCISYMGSSSCTEVQTSPVRLTPVCATVRPGVILLEQVHHHVHHMIITAWCPLWNLQH